MNVAYSWQPVRTRIDWCVLKQGKSLKQELQRQQKALAAAQENEATLQTRLADKEAALQAAENRQRRKHVRTFGNRYSGDIQKVAKEQSVCMVSANRS